MKQFLFLASALTALIPMCCASPCTSGSLTSYISLGSSGCTIGNNTFYDFQTLTGIAFATPIGSQTVTITPLGGAFDPGISVATDVTAGSGRLLELLFTYRISGGLYTGDSIAITNSSETGAGSVTGVQNFCRGGTFGTNGISGCTGIPGSLVTLDGTQNQDSVTFPATALLSITDDFTLDGTAGSASGGTITDRFTAVPEPAGFLLTALGLVLAAALKIRLAGANSFRR